MARTIPVPDSSCNRIRRQTVVVFAPAVADPPQVVALDLEPHFFRLVPSSVRCDVHHTTAAPGDPRRAVTIGVSTDGRAGGALMATPGRRSTVNVDP